ncbi:MAG: hypothetical protein U5J63_07825 [Fodinibius sp.]|nr:hypothetical protein [Fodinibius sp.]
MPADRRCSIRNFEVSRYFCDCRGGGPYCEHGAHPAAVFEDDYEDKDRPETPTLRHVICGAGPLTVKVAQTFEERLALNHHGDGLFANDLLYLVFVPAGDIDKEAA